MKSEPLRGREHELQSDKSTSHVVNISSSAMVWREFSELSELTSIQFEQEETFRVNEHFEVLIGNSAQE